MPPIMNLAAVCAVLLVAMSAGCSSENKHAVTAKTPKVSWGRTADGESVELYTLSNAKGAQAQIMNYGGVVVSLKVPDRSGAMADVVAGFDNFEGYLKPPPYFGAIIGRYGNRIAKARFSLNGVEYMLASNNRENSLHGGVRGFDKRIWAVKELSPQSIELTYLSKDGEEGFPGNLSATVTYTLTDANELKIEYSATTDKPTVVNLTNHSYFNLAGHGEGDILAHQVTINAGRFTPVDKGNDQQLILGGGYDHNWVLNKAQSGLETAAKVMEPKSGRVMEVLTTEPGLQFYTGNFLDGTLKGKGGKVYGRRSAFCMETQHFPDSPNKPAFPSTVLNPGGRYQTTTIYRFSTI